MVVNEHDLKVIGAVIGVGITLLCLLMTFLYWLYRTFVSETACKSRQDCIEGQIKVVETKLDGFREVMETETDNIKCLIKKRNGDEPE
jgi:hypothetical protein